MKQETSPMMILVAVLIVLAMLGGLYYKFMGRGSERPSEVASPYGMPGPGESFKTPPPGGSGRNTITGEPLPARPTTPMSGVPGLPLPPSGSAAHP